MLSRSIEIQTAAKRLQRRGLAQRIRRGVSVADLSLEFPIQWVEDINGDGKLAPGPGLGEQSMLVNHDLSVSTGLEVSCSDPYFASEEYLAGVQNALKGAIAEIGYSEELQINWMTWDEDADLLAAFGKVRPGDPPFAKWWRTSLAEREKGRYLSGDLRRFRSFIFLNVLPDAAETLGNPWKVGQGGMFGKQNVRF